MSKSRYPIYKNIKKQQLTHDFGVLLGYTCSDGMAYTKTINVFLKKLKNTNMRYALFLVIVFLAACQSSESINSLDATLNGAKTDTKLIVEGPGYSKDFTIVEGVIKDTFIIQRSGLYSFIYQRNRLQAFLEPGQAIKFEGDAKDLQTSAEFEPPHQKVWDYYKAKKDITSKYLSQRRLFGLEPNEFLASLETGSKLVDSLLAVGDLPSELVSLEKERIQIDEKKNTYIYPLAADKKIDDLSEQFQDPLAGVDLTDEEKFIENPSYAELVSTHFNIEMNQDTSAGYEDVFLKRVSALPEGNIRNSILYGTMQYLLTPNERLDEFFTFFNEHSTNAKDIKKMKEQYGIFQSLTNGNLSPQFEYENYNGGTSALSDYRGKYVYIDVWATWCGPCIGEIPSLKEKEAKYHDSNVEFVSISIDESKAYDTWRNMVKDKELGGSQLMADNAWQSKFVQDYQIKGIPRFILVDPEGMIVSADAPRPSSDKLDEKFDELGL